MRSIATKLKTLKTATCSATFFEAKIRNPLWERVSRHWWWEQTAHHKITNAGSSFFDNEFDV